MNRMAGREHHLMQCFHSSFHFQQNHTLRFVFHFMCLQTASGQKTTVQLLKATQAACIKLSLNWNKSLEQKIATKKSHSRALTIFFKPLNAKIKLQVAFRWGKLSFADNTQKTFPPQELLGTTLKLDPLLPYPGHPHVLTPKNCDFSCAYATVPHHSILKSGERRQKSFFKQPEWQERIKIN